MLTSYSNRSADRLLSLVGNDFVATCYLWILNREPDTSGFSHYLSRVASGESKLAIAADLASSDEAKALPLSKKPLITGILGLHAAAIISRAFTSRRRAYAARQIQRYFDVISGSESNQTAQDDAASLGSGDPFKDYLNSVINARDD
jgi:Domain of unknown function (DUF4214)